MALGIFTNGCNTATISLGLAYFNCTTCVTYWPISGNCAALLVSKRAPAVLPCASGIALTNLSPMLTMTDAIERQHRFQRLDALAHGELPPRRQGDGRGRQGRRRAGSCG